MFKVNNKDTKTKSLTSFWFLYCYLWTYFAHCSSVSIVNIEHVTAGWEEAITAQKMKFSIKDFFSKCDKISNFWRISSHLLRKSLMENLIFLCSALSLTYVPLKNTSWKIPGDKEAEKKKKKMDIEGDHSNCQSEGNTETQSSIQKSIEFRTELFFRICVASTTLMYCGDPCFEWNRGTYFSTSTAWKVSKYGPEKTPSLDTFHAVFFFIGWQCYVRWSQIDGYRLI